jgi:hypothetical protein
MFNYEFSKNETILTYDQDCQIFIEENFYNCCVLLTNVNIIFFKDINEEKDYSELLRITKGVNSMPIYESFFVEKISKIKKIVYEEELYKIYFSKKKCIPIRKSQVVEELIKLVKGNC